MNFMTSSDYSLYDLVECGKCSKIQGATVSHWPPECGKVIRKPSTNDSEILERLSKTIKE